MSNRSLDYGFVLATQIIQRQLEQVEEKQRQLEERGVAVEKALRGEAGTSHFTFSFNAFTFLVIPTSLYIPQAL